MQTFPSKKDLWLEILIWVSLGFGLVAVLLSSLWPAIIIMLVVVVFTAWIWFYTFYSITEEHLIIKSGPFSSTIPLANIRGVKKSNSPLASSALSLDRLEIRYKDGVTLISPEKAEDFVKLLKEKTNL